MAEAQLGWLPDDEYPAVAQSGWPPKDEYLEEARSPRVELVDAVAQLQKELEEFRTEFGYGSARRSAIPSQTSGWSGFTSTSVPMYAGPVGTNIGKCLRLLFVRTDGTGHGSTSACVPPRRGRPQRNPAGAGIPAGVARGFGGGAVGALYLPWEIG